MEKEKKKRREKAEVIQVKRNNSKCNVCGIELQKGQDATRVSGGYRCFKCEESERLDWNNWCDLYDYLEDKYFIKDIPIALMKDLRELRLKYEYEKILKCYKSIEGSLLPNYYKIDFDSDLQRSKYLISGFLNAIDSLEREMLKSEYNEIVANDLNEKLILINKKQPIVLTEKINYDFLD